MGRRDAIVVPGGLRPWLVRPADWSDERSWRITAAACRASGVLAWAARVQRPGGESDWIEGTSPSRPAVLQSECVDALVAALETTPPGAAVELIAPTSLRYLVEGVAFDAAEDAPEHRLSQLAAERRVWARYALGELETPVAECLARAYLNLAPLAGASTTLRGALRSHFELLALLFEPDLALLVQTRPGASREDLGDAAAHVRPLISRADNGVVR